MQQRWKALVKYGAVALAVAVGAAVWVYVAVFQIRSDVKVFKPPVWSWLEGRTDLMTFPDRNLLLLRRIRSGEPLRRFVPSDEAAAEMVRAGEAGKKLRRARRPLPHGYESEKEVRSIYYYEYDPSLDELKEVDAGAWDTEHGSVSVCYAVGRSPFGPSPLPPPLTTAGWERVRPARDRATGEEGVFWRVSPSGEQVSILSADRELFGSTGLLGGGPTRGSSRQHHHEVFALDGNNKVGRTLRVPMISYFADSILVWEAPRGDKLVAAGWSADERFVVYVGRTSLCIVPTVVGGD